MSITLRSDMYCILQHVKDVRLGDSLDPTVDAIFAAIAKRLTSDDVMLAIRDSGLSFPDDRGTHYVTSPEHAMTAALKAAGIAVDEGGQS